MTNDNLRLGFSGDLMFYAARGFIEGMSRSQRDVFQSLFSGDQASAATATCLEQANFGLGYGESSDPYAPILSALDYALPRMSTAGWTVATEIERLWDTLPEPTRMLVRAKIDTAIRNGRSGASVDTAHWARVARLPIDEAERGELTAF
ncbi:hypothetical protein HFO56_23140 [Rhizobium laguerreae]|uniref:hypothetical protein n=1 Tax=Rhizobium laguerreae TaxID=1076926 RepID=UPI001C928237|nr:hypothetical protein [Rhizobium laguerreae]MBY3155221.1 hypothetical protein [Rhizobium laguerreae]